MLDFFIVALIGLIGGVTHIFIFKEGKFYKPKTFVDDDGRTFRDYGFWKELFVGVVAAFIATVPTWTFVPLPYKILPALFASITGSSFVMSAAKQYLNKQKELKQEELDQYAVKKEPTKEETEDKSNLGG